MRRYNLNILIIGDIVGKPGRRILLQSLPQLLVKHEIDLCIANVENAAGGYGITPQIAQQLLDAEINVLTSGNHIWDQKEITDFMGHEPRLLRPLNYPEGVPGRGSILLQTASGTQVGIINLSGRVFMKSLDCPFRLAEQEVAKLKAQGATTIIVDFHAEATSEKIALGWFLDGQVSAVIGTHTHVQTADERILPAGTAYITDLGMTGAHDSVIGLKKEMALKRFLTQIPKRFEVAKGNVQLNGALLQIDESSGKARQIQRLQLKQ